MMPMVEEGLDHGRRAGGHDDNLPAVSPVSTGTEARKLMSSADTHLEVQYVIYNYSE